MLTWLNLRTVNPEWQIIIIIIITGVPAYIPKRVIAGYLLGVPKSNSEHISCQQCT